MGVVLTNNSYLSSVLEIIERPMSNQSAFLRFAMLAFSALLAASPLGAQCSFSLTPNTASFAAAGGNGLVTIAASTSNCTRTATSNTPWITVSFGSPGTGNGTVGYTVTPNTSVLARTGTLNVAGQTLTISEAGATCSFLLNPASAIADTGGSSGTFAVSTNCSWTPTTTSTWLTVTSGSGTGEGTVAYVAAANTTPTARVGSISVGNQTFTVNQGPANCTVALNPASAAIAVGGGSGSFSFSTACTWTALTQASWITLTSAASGMSDGMVSFAVTPNTTNGSRSGTISLLNQSFTVTQAQSCALTLSPQNASFQGAGGTGSIAVTASTNTCDRSAVSDSAWVTITAGQTGTGTGTVTYTVASNPGSTVRTATISAGGQPMFITQLPSTCSYTLAPISVTAPVGTSAGIFTVTAQTGCAWTAVSTADWLTVSGAAGGSASGSVGYSVGANASGQPRNASIAVGISNFNVFQPGALCDVALSASTATVGTAGDTVSFDVTATQSCNWVAASSVAWITLNGSASGAGAGSVSFKVAPNSGNQIRTGSLTVGNQIFRITQGANSCVVTLGANSLSVGAGSSTGSVDVAATCSWIAVSNASWLQISSGANGTTSGTVNFAVLPNTAASARSGLIVISGQTFTLNQGAAGCTLALAPAPAALPARGGTGVLTVTGNVACSWQPTTDSDWLKLTWTSVSGSGMVNFAASANSAAIARTATVTVNGQTAVVTQAALVLKITAAGVANAASFTAGPIAPGEIITIFGTGFGPEKLVSLQLSANGRFVTTALSQTRVLFDGVPAALLYAVDGQLSAVVPYSVGGKSTTLLQVESYGLSSDPVMLQVSASSPAIFTVDSSGKGPGAILNANLSLNTPASPAVKGAFVIIYATGEGFTAPAGVDGKLAIAPYPAPMLPVKVTIGGLDAEVSYAGGAPGLVAGLIQINARVPAKAPSHAAVPVTIKIGNVESPVGVTLAIR